MILAIAWAIPGPAVEHVARQETLLLGRYGVAQFVTLTIATLLLGLVAALLWNPRSLAETVLLAALALGSTFAGVVLISSFARVQISPRYQSAPVASVVTEPALAAQLTGVATWRDPNSRWEGIREDRPAPGRSYPLRVAGRPEIPVVLTTDDRGLRNPPRSGRYDVTVVGDPFTEGLLVSDDQTWWSLLSRQTGLRIYNTSVAGLAILRDWCAERGVDFVSLTAMLRDRVAEGVPVYFTYDAHWTEEGHAAVAVHFARVLH